ncbi:MAG: PP2C family protein-serine/threonine phosphatase, partial [Gemmatirosa sp.]
MRTRRAVTLGSLFAALFLVRWLVDRPTFLGVTFLLVLPVVLAALWFGTRGAVLIAFAAALSFYVAEELDPSVDVETHTLLVAALVRAFGLTVAGVFVAVLFERQVRITRALDGDVRPLRGRPRAAPAARQRGADRPGRYLRDFVTAACVVHRPADGTLAWALAGHHAPLALASGRELDPAGAGQPLGLEHDLDVTAATISLGDGDGVLLYTDGILDARDEHGARFGEERLSALVAGYSGATAEGV